MLAVPGLGRGQRLEHARRTPEVTQLPVLGQAGPLQVARLHPVVASAGCDPQLVERPGHPLAISRQLRAASGLAEQGTKPFTVALTESLEADTELVDTALDALPL